MSGRPPGPVCSSRVGNDWIDLGTSCRTRTDAPGVTDFLAAVARAALQKISPKKAKFDHDHVYSKSPEAGRKRDLDLQIIGDDYGRSDEIRIDTPAYLKELIKQGSGGSVEVKTAAGKIQFFIVRGGAEGFLDPSMANDDANDKFLPGTTTDGSPARDFHFDLNDLLTVFDANGNFIGSAFLQRPTSITGKWSQATANEIYDAWDNKNVSIYRNKHPGWVEYLGLTVDEGKKNKGWVDMHKQEATNGCMFIVDPNTPDLGNAALNAFEPKLIVDILKSIGKKPEDVQGMISLGIMHLIDM